MQHVTVGRGDLVVRTKWGLHIPAADLYLDARRAPGLVFVSHAHADHCSSAARILCTPETAELHRRRRGGREFVTLRFGERLALGASSIQLSPAGHTLGSSMALVETPAGRIAYTGDFKLRPGAFARAVAVPQCDALVMECTFGDPRYRFPAEHEVLERLYRFIEETLAAKAIPVLLAYAFGKTQEALHHLTARGYRVAVAEPGASLCAAHVELGHEFPGPGSWRAYTGDDAGAQVLITTSRGRQALSESGRRYRFVHLTGWAVGRRFARGDLSLPLSGHADFDELVRTARESGAAKVYTVHGSSRFAAHLRALGMDAEHLGPGSDSSPPAAASRPVRGIAPLTPQLSLELS